VDVTPVNYELTFEPDLKKFIFSGTESITVICKKSVNIITMHCAELKIKSCLISFDGKTIKSTPKTDENIGLYDITKTLFARK